MNQMQYTSGWRTAIIATTLTAMLGLGGCAWLGSSDTPKPMDLGTNIVNFPVEQVWQVRIPDLKDASLRVQVVGQDVLLAAADGTIISLNAASGRENWRVSSGQPVQAGVGADALHTAIVTLDNQLVVFSAGNALWKQSLSTAAYTAPLVAGGRVFVLTADRTVSAFDAHDGTRLWTHRRDGEPLVLRQQGALLPYGNTLLAGLSGRLVAINPDNGVVLWEAPLASPRGTNDVERLVDIVGPTSRQDHQICARAFQASVGCIDASRGQILWTQTAKGTVGVDGDAQYIFGVESNGVVQAWNRRDGSKLWSVDRFQHRKLTAPLVLGRSVIVGDNTGQLHLLSKQDGSHLNRLVTDSTGIAATPVIAADTLVAVTRGGGIYGFRPD